MSTSSIRKHLRKGAQVLIVAGPHVGHTGIVEWPREIPATEDHPDSQVAVALTLTNQRVLVDPAHLELVSQAPR